MLITESIEEFIPYLPTRARILGLDVGKKTVGLALSDITLTVATAYTTVRRTKFSKDAEAILKIIHKDGVEALVIGMPYGMEGEVSKSAQAAKQFAFNLVKLHDIPVLLWDERFTTEIAHNTMLEADLSRQKRAEKVDQLAASIILQHALDAIKHHQKAS